MSDTSFGDGGKITQQHILQLFRELFLNLMNQDQYEYVYQFDLENTKEMMDLLFHFKQVTRYVENRIIDTESYDIDIKFFLSLLCQLINEVSNQEINKEQIIIDTRYLFQGDY